MKEINSVEEYLKHIGSDKEYKHEIIPCEVCGSKDFTIICHKTDIGGDYLAPLPVQSCKKCGFLMQNPRFSKEFYKRFYEEFYPISRVKSNSNKPNDPKNIGGKTIVNEDGSPTESHFKSAYKRAKFLYEYIQNNNFYIPKKTFLDVGCGCGAFIKYFEEQGFESYGNDPEPLSVKGALDRGIIIDNIPGEEMKFEKNTFGIIIIMGSLEHAHDPNIILQKCWEYLAEDGLFVVQGRFFPVSESFRWLNANHHRFLTNETAQAILVKHGFSIIRSTIDYVCGTGTGRVGNGFVFASKDSKNKKYLEIEDSKDLINLIEEKNLKINPEELKKKLKKHDANFTNVD